VTGPQELAVNKWKMFKKTKGIAQNHPEARADLVHPLKKDHEAKAKNQEAKIVKKRAAEVKKEAAGVKKGAVEVKKVKEDLGQNQKGHNLNHDQNHNQSHQERAGVEASLKEDQEAEVTNVQ